MPCHSECQPLPTDSAAILRRKPTRIELKPDDREEYFAARAEKQKESGDKDKPPPPSDKDVRIGLTKTR